jgi:hypothetical protein
MAAPAPPALDLGPDWVVAEMPPGYQNRVAEIQRLAADLESMSRFGRLLTETGARLGEAVRDVFASLQYDAALTADGNLTTLVVPLDRGRIHLHIAGDGRLIQKKSPEVSRIFQLLQAADDRDHVVIVTNVEPDRQPADRGQALSAEAAGLVTRMGASHLAATTLFALWKLSLEEPERAREQVVRLHAHEGGVFELPSYARL